MQASLSSESHSVVGLLQDICSQAIVVWRSGHKQTFARSARPRRFALIHSHRYAAQSGRGDGMMEIVMTKIASTTTVPINTLNDLFLRVAAAASARALLWQDEAEQWQPLSSDQIYQRVRAVAEALLEWGIKKGDRIAIISENRWEWAVIDFATLAIGAVDVPLYATLTGAQMAEILRDSGCRVAFISSRPLFDKVAAVRESTRLERVVLMDAIVTDTALTAAAAASDAAGGLKGAVPFSSLIAGADVRKADRDVVFDALVRSVSAKDLATLIYTSGTTGEPKGVMLTHGNIASNISYATSGFDLCSMDSSISVLPLSHITARALDYAMYFYGVQVAYCPLIEKMAAAMKQVRPTILVGVPRMYEKIRHEVERRASLSRIRVRILAWAVRLGSKHRATVYDGRQPASVMWRTAKRLVYSKIAAGFGGRVRLAVSGGAPLGADTANWFASVGVQILEGYGLTETSPLIAINTLNVHRIGTVGRPVPIVECRLAEDGELLVRGPSVFSGYWNKPQANAECFVNGWFLTGDIAHIDADGFLSITDRKKELIKTSGGKFVAPQPIENRLKTNALVAHVALVGDKRKFVSAIIAPNFASLETWASHHGIHSLQRSELIAHPAVTEVYLKIVQSVNADLASFETVKRFRLVAEEWTIESGELTPSMKLKRRVITARYAALIDAIYADEATAHGGSARPDGLGGPTPSGSR